MERTAARHTILPQQEGKRAPDMPTKGGGKGAICGGSGGGPELEGPWSSVGYCGLVGGGAMSLVSGISHGQMLLFGRE